MQVTSDGGISLRLGEDPALVRQGLREEIQARLGETTFVDPRIATRKHPGEFALTFDQLRA